MPTQGPSQPVEAIVKINKPAVPPKQKTKSAKVVKSKHASHEDVLDLQVKVLKGQLEEQKLNKLKLQLQIDMLKSIALMNISSVLRKWLSFQTKFKKVKHATPRNK